MKLEFETLEMENYGCLKTQKVPLAGLGHGVHFVRGVNKFKPALGSNGVGKSSMWNAMSWCLTGSTLSGLKSTEVRPWSSKAVTTVSVSACIDSKVHVIKRSTISNGLWIDDKVVSQEEIYRLIGLTDLTLRHTLLLGQGQELFFDLKPTGKMEILSECLDLDKWDVRSKRAREATKEIESAIKVQEAVVVKTEEQLLRRRHDMRDFKTKSSEWESDIADRAAKREDETKALTKRLEKQMNELGAADLAYDGAETELRAIRRSLITAGRDFSQASAVASDIKVTLDAIEARVAELKEISKGGECPTCGQVIKDKKARAEHALIEINKQKKRLTACDTQWTKAIEAKNTLGGRIAKLRKDEDDFTEKSNSAIDARTRSQTAVSQTKADLAALKKQTDDVGENPYTHMMTKARKEIGEFKSQLSELIDTINRANRKLVRTKYWIDGFKNVRLYLLEEVLDELQGVTNSMLPMIGLDGWEVEYAIEKETKSGNVTSGLNVTITMDDGKPVNWKAWSGGEGQRLRILGAMALSEVLLRHAGVECDMMVLDEPTKHLSPEGVMMTVDFLCDRAKDMQIFYVDHTARASNRFASDIVVTRSTKGLSTITTEYDGARGQ